MRFALPQNSVVRKSLLFN